MTKETVKRLVSLRRMFWHHNGAECGRGLGWWGEMLRIRYTLATQNPCKILVPDHADRVSPSKGI